MDNEIVRVEQADMLGAISRAEVDMQISTAKAYPRDIAKVLNTISTLATMDKETAEDCFYVLRRKNDKGQDCVIEGLSVRMAEIIAYAWGNLRVQTRVVGNDGKTITAQAVCMDLERNVAVMKEVPRRITTKSGNTYSEDMQVVTGNAASSIAFRNAVLTVIPKAVTKRIIEEVKKVALGQSIDLEERRQRIFAYLAKLGVTEAHILNYLGVKSVADIDKEKVFILSGTANAIKEGTTTAKESFFDPMVEAEAQKIAVKKAETAQDRVAVAMAASQGIAPAKELFEGTTTAEKAD